MHLGKTYERVSPKGDTSLVTIGSYKEKEYQEELAKQGFVFEEVKDTDNGCEVCHA